MLRELIVLLKELEGECSICNRCGMCQAVCPVFLATGHEADVARGKLALLDGLIDQLLTNPYNVLKRLNRCLLCGSCESGCSRKVKILKLFVKARLIINGYLGLSPIKKIILRKIVARPLVFDKAAMFASKWQNLFIKPGPSDTSVSRRFFPFFKGRNIPPVAREPFHTLARKSVGGSSGAGPKVVFFAGCIIDRVMPEVGLACVDVLKRFCTSVDLVEHEACCGIPAAASGDADSFQTLVKHNLDKLKDLRYDYLVTACATCTFTIKKIWPLLYGENRNLEFEKIEELSQKVVDISEFLVKETGTAALAFYSPEVADPVEVTWHDPCHLKKTSGLFKAPRQLLTALSGYTLKEMEGADLCCGAGGSFGLEHYDISTKIGEVKSRNIIATGAPIVATGCPGCMIQLKDMLAKSGGFVEVKHIAELVAESLDKKENKP